MNIELEARLHACYPDGLYHRFNKEQANLQPAHDFWQRLPAVLSSHDFYCKRPDYWSGYERAVEFKLSRNGDPDYWYFSDNRAEKIAILRETGKPFVVIEALVSTVIPALYLNIQETWFNPETYGNKVTGKYDDGLKTLHWLRDSVYQPWASLIADLRALGVELGLADLDETTLKQDVPFITEPVYSDEGDEDYYDNVLCGTNSPEEIAYLKSKPQDTCCLYDCLFCTYR